MIPILYESNEVSFESNGIGRLSDIKSCKVNESLNGLFEVEWEYPLSGIHFEDIQLGRYIVCSAGKGNKQPFELYAISKPLNGIVTIYGRHISYRASLIPVRPFTSQGLQNTLDQLNVNAMENSPFTFRTDKTSSATYSQIKPLSMRSCLGGTEGSILDVYGGEYEWDVWDIKLWSKRGADNGVQLRYAKNLINLTQKESIEDTITGVVPYWEGQDEVVYGDILTSGTEGNYPYPRVKVVDVSEDLDSNIIPTKAQVNAAGRTYMSTQSMGIPSINLEVSFINLRDTEEYKDVAVLEDVSLGDTVHVIYGRLGVDASARVIKTEWDSLLDRYNTITIGQAKATLSTSIANQQAKNSSYVTKSEATTIAKTYASQSAGIKGGYIEMVDTNNDDCPDELLIMDSPKRTSAKKVWKYDKTGWSYSDTGYSGNYKQVADLGGGLNADFIKSGTISNIPLKNSKLTIDAGVITIAKDDITYRLDDKGMTVITDDTEASITVSEGKPTIDGFVLINCENESGTPI